MYVEASARKDMEGSYLCRAKNAAGETEDLVQVIVNENGDNGRNGKIHHPCLTMIVHKIFKIKVIF